MNFPTKILISGQQIKRVYEKQFEDICEKYQITQNEADIIVFLANNREFDTARDIVEFRMIAKSYISKSVEDLIKKDFLVRTFDKEDRRIIHLKLTDKSIPMVDDARLKQKKFIEKLFVGMDTNEIEMFESLLTKILENANMTSNKEKR